ncbi:hypothetical protein [Streptomyces sp. 3214.6]|uniref:hypothetical protein n=1 Tax=Streptomyces sp. 3214.6 TaxID=1882757 RepID=UPI00090A1283|nr:hypothetical protein [Streptomyces sp. 3214.6]SHI65327.1 hypothetical protein SAMN05444521_8144 [Streptomyces sp. 3214.6]
MSARTLDFRIHVVADDWLAMATRAQLHDLAEQFPVGVRVRHACGREGTVALDQPEHVPGTFDGHPTAVCLAGPSGTEPWLFVTWDNEYDLVWRVWVPVSKISKGRAPAVNRPGNTARIGGRR